MASPFGAEERMQTTISEKNLRRLLPDRAAPPLVFERLDSTNAELARLCASGASEGAAVFARSQTAGRGRLGRTFESPEGGLYLSVLWRPSESDPLFPITALAAVAVRRALLHICGVDTQIKWRNDLLLGGKKLCGILAELKTDARGLCVLLGIGVNVNTRAFCEDLQPRATSVFLHTGRAVDETRLAAEILRELDAARRVLSENPKPYLAEYADACITVGKRVTVLRAETARSALALGIDTELGGALRIRYDDGSEELLISGEATLRAENGEYF